MIPLCHEANRATHKRARREWIAAGSIIRNLGRLRGRWIMTKDVGLSVICAWGSGCSC